MEKVLEMIQADLREIKEDTKAILKKDPVGRMECEGCRNLCRTSLKQHVATVKSEIDTDIADMKVDMVQRHGELQQEIKASKGVPPWLCVVMAVLSATLSWIFGVYPVIQKTVGG